jgi:uncharacterized protein VirK/YbjX
VFVGSLLALARQKHFWSPAVFARTSWGALTNIGMRREILQLLDFPPYAELAQRSSRFVLKFLARDFLVRGLTVAERASCFVHHYRRLRAVLPERLLRQTLQHDTILCEIGEGSNHFTLTMGLPKALDKEGEMSINLLVDGETVFVLSFAIVPGCVVKSEAADVLLISHLQGIKGAYSQIHLATKTLHDVAPGAILLAAVQGIAIAWGIGQLAGVCATRQTCYTEDLDAIFKSNYDEFFTELGMVRHPDGFFLSPVPMKNKPLKYIKQGHKLRTKEKRAFKLQIQFACGRFFKSARA